MGTRQLSWSHKVPSFNLKVAPPCLPYIVNHPLDRSGWPWGSNPDKRRSKTIRFSDHEWELVERAAARRAIPAAEYLRSAAIDSAEGRTAAVDAENIETIRRIDWGTYIGATLKRNELLRGGHGDEIDKRVEAARESQASPVGAQSKSSE